MNLETFNKIYEGIGTKTKITIFCDCGKPVQTNKEKAKENVTSNGSYICRSCSMVRRHTNRPVSNATREKLSQSLTGVTKSPETRLKMSESRKAYFNTKEGQDFKLICAKTAAEGHACNRFHKSKRKGLFPSIKNNCKVAYNSSYELKACVDLENDPNVKGYQTQLYYEYEDRPRTLDFLIEYIDGSKVVVEIKPKSRLDEIPEQEQLKHSKANALANGYGFELWTEDHFNMTPIELRCWADGYRNLHLSEGFDYVDHRRKLNRDKSQRHYAAKIATDTIEVYCPFCSEEHTVLNKTYHKNLERNGRYICEREGGKIAGSKPKKKKENPYAACGKKQCNQCQRVLDTNAFGIDKVKSDGLATRCKECRAGKSKDNYLNQ